MVRTEEAKPKRSNDYVSRGYNIFVLVMLVVIGILIVSLKSSPGYPI